MKLNIGRWGGWSGIVKALRKKGWTQRAISVHTGIGQSYISHLEGGKRRNINFDDGLKLFGLFADRVLKRTIALATKK